MQSSIISTRGRVGTGACRAALVVGLLHLLLSGALHASTVRPLNLEELNARAARVVVGRCVSVESDHDTTRSISTARIRLVVERTLKGEPGETIEFRMFTGTDGSSAARSALVPRFRVGEESILFLYGESRSGFTSPVGLGQGKFVVLSDKDGRGRASNGAGERALFHGLSEPTRRRLRPEHEPFDDGPGVSADALIDAVRSLNVPAVTP